MSVNKKQNKNITEIIDDIKYLEFLFKNLF